MRLRKKQLQNIGKHYENSITRIGAGGLLLQEEHSMKKI